MTLRTLKQLSILLFGMVLNGCLKESGQEFDQESDLIKAPENIRVSYDTSWGIVNIKWDRITHPEHYKYLIFRNIQNETTPTLLAMVEKEILEYNDTIYNLGEVKLEYRIKSEDENLNQSIKFSNAAAISAVNSADYQTKLTLTVLEGTVESIPHCSTAHFRLIYNNPFRNVKRLVWYFNNIEGGRKEVLVKSGTLEFGGAWKGRQTIDVEVEAKDESNREIRTDVSVFIAAPKPNDSPECSVKF